MIELEEELAVYKDRYNECSSNCTNMSRKFTELSEEHQALLSHSKSVRFQLKNMFKQKFYFFYFPKISIVFSASNSGFI